MSITYVALGDSIAAGGPTTFSYVDLVADAARSVLGDVELRNLAVNGWTSGDVLGQIRGSRSAREAVRGADLISITVGGNDLLRAMRSAVDGAYRGRDPIGSIATAVARFEETWLAILDELVSLRSPAEAAMRATNYYDPLPGNPQFRGYLRPEVARWAERFAREQNRGICREAADRGFRCADLYGAFNAEGEESPAARGLLAWDGFHPSEAGQRLIAETVVSLGFEPLASGRRAAPRAVR